MGSRRMGPESSFQMPLTRFQGGPSGPLVPPARDGSAGLPLPLPRGRLLAPVGWRETQNAGPQHP